MYRQELQKTMAHRALLRIAASSHYASMVVYHHSPLIMQAHYVVYYCLAPDSSKFALPLGLDSS